MMRTIRSVATSCLFCASASIAAVTAHPAVETDADAAPYAVRADGVTVPLERVGNTHVAYYARFSTPSAVEVEITVGRASTLEAAAEPARFVRNLQVTGATVRFAADGPGPRHVKLTADGKLLPSLFIIVEPMETSRPDPRDPKTLDVTRYGVTANEKPQTTTLQKVLDQCAGREGGGIVYVPPGRYLTGTLRVGSNTRLYLAGGAVLQAVDDPDAFPRDVGFKESGGEGIHHSHCRLLIFDRAKNSGLFGRGTLDANGDVLRNKHERRVQVIDAHDCRDLAIEGVVLRDTASWTLHLLHCTGVRVSDVKILADWGVPNSDGVDPDSCRDVLIERLFSYTGDDSIAIKTTGNSGLLQDSSNITIRDSVVMTKKTALKVGTETRANISNVLFENIDVIGSSRGMAVWVRDGGTISNITYRNIRLDLFEFSKEGMSGQPIYLTNEKRHGEGVMKNVRFEQITCRAPWWSVMESKAASDITNVQIDGMTLAVKPRADKKDAKPLFAITRAKGVEVRNLTVDWSAAVTDQWTGLWSDAAAARVEGLKQISPPAGQ